jgi:hypothetical protein
MSRYASGSINVNAHSFLAIDETIRMINTYLKLRPGLMVYHIIGQLPAAW